jgi:hypothetical protein
MIKFLTFLNVLDAEGRLSITNIAMYSILIKICLSQFEWASAVSLFVVCLNYAHKRVVNQSAQEPQEDTVTLQIEEMKSKFEEVQSKVSALVLQAGIKTIK